ncbi:hypothetical protein SAMN05421770_10328 [Granulicella rosea]|uniref:Uncharacterized protein n=2 Tax=Granulicella rosea TaxID=474952 RepID=A0A239IE89_9BACT|nr:hypothetical protein SAMN05421770_10328 [Granulicella rosea]
MRDLESKRWIKLKAFFFLLTGLLACGLLLLDRPTLRTATLLVIAIWSFCRLYYFAFYVIERYLDPEYRYAGVLSAIRAWFSTGR